IWVFRRSGSRNRAPHCEGDWSAMNLARRDRLELLTQSRERLVLAGSSGRDEPDSNLLLGLQTDDDVQVLRRLFCCEESCASFVDTLDISGEVRDISKTRV